jgi:hypothetical protein
MSTLIRGEAGVLGEGDLPGVVGVQPNAVELGRDVAPGVAAGDLGGTDQQQRQPRQLHPTTSTSPRGLGCAPVTTSPAASGALGKPNPATSGSRTRSPRPRGPRRTTDTYLQRSSGESRGPEPRVTRKNKAAVAHADKVLIAAYYMMASRDKVYHELGADYFTSRDDPEMAPRPARRPTCLTRLRRLIQPVGV